MARPGRAASWSASTSSADDGLARQDDAAIAAQRRWSSRSAVGPTRWSATTGGGAGRVRPRRERHADRRSAPRPRARWHELVARIVRRPAHPARPRRRRARHRSTRSTGGDHRPPMPSARRRAIGRRRSVGAWMLTVCGLPVLTAVFLRDRRRRAVDRAARCSSSLDARHRRDRRASRGAPSPAIAASLLVNWFFVEPRTRFTIAEGTTTSWRWSCSSPWR